MLTREGRRRAAAAFGLGLLGSAATLRPAEAAPLVWTVEGFFQGSVSPPFGSIDIYPIGGSFVFDAATGAYSDWDIAFTVSFVTGGRLTPANATLGAGSTATRLSLEYRSESGTPGDFSDDFAAIRGRLVFGLTAPLTGAGGVVPLTASGSSWFLEYFIFLFPNNIIDGLYGLDLVSGTLTAAPPPPSGVPGPAALALMAPALGMLFAARHRARPS